MSRLLYVGTRKGLFTVENKSGRWEIVGAEFLGIPVTAVLPDASTGSLFVALKHGHFGVKLHRRENGAWPEIQVPTYPEKPADVEDLEPIRQTPIPWNTEQIWVVESGASDGELWCGTIPGGLFRSTDNGDSWQINQPLWDEPKRKSWFGGGYDFPGIHSISVDPRGDGDRVVVGVSCGGVWKTEDRGQSWNVPSQGMIARYMPEEQGTDPNIQDPHRVVQSPSNPDVFWSQHHSGVFRSTDGCQSWHEIDSLQPSTFGFGVAVHPENADVAWFAPAVSDETRVPVDGQVVIVRTRDGGQSGEILRNGLPQQHGYDIVYRHGLDVDSSGDVLAVGSTSGCLWMSSNQGDSFDAVSTHLPPVYTVRFADS
jgi:hypothetical protein